MLSLKIAGEEFYDEKNEVFATSPLVVLKLEHSLISISEWEAKWKKPFLEDKPPKTYEETIDYIRCMTLNKGIPENIYNRLTMEHIDAVNAYISDKRTATWFSKKTEHHSPNKEKITSELIYYWMIEEGIPFECQKWHLNRLLTLIRVCNIKRNPSKPMSKKDLMARNRSLNAKRRAAIGSRG